MAWPLSCEWYVDTSIHDLESVALAHGELHQFALDRVEKEEVETRRLHRSLVEKVEEGRREDVVAALRMRIRRWLPEPSALALELMRRRLQRLGRRCKSWAPCIAEMKVAVRGVCTERGLHQREAKCAMCDMGRDAVQHWAVCPAVRHATTEVYKLCRMEEGPLMMDDKVDFSELLLLGPAGTLRKDAVKMSAIDAIVHLHKCSRVRGTSPALDEVARVVQARVKANCTYSRSPGQLLEDERH